MRKGSRKLHRKRKMKIIISWPCQRTKEAVEYEDDGDTNYSQSPWNGFQKLKKSLEELEIRERVEAIKTR